MLSIQNKDATQRPPTQSDGEPAADSVNSEYSDDALQRFMSVMKKKLERVTAQLRLKMMHAERDQLIKSI